MEKIALITGAGRGIGAATAQELGRRGFHVIVNYRADEPAAASVVRRIEAAGGVARAVQADVCDPGQVAALVEGCARVDAHATAKAALNAFAQHVAAEAGAWGIAVNTVAPAAVRTEGSATMLTPEVEEALGRRSVLGRMLDPQDVAAVVGSILDGGFDAVAGVKIPVDAGQRVLSG
ncbi:SDR family oxidoreductase [Nonomuraea insulae]|uniref:SDR family oxidoreductase n=1 Tax=Nonomuraea insulae TaxID=1616787 RepID=A0ABW1CC58_9ACTN